MSRCNKCKWILLLVSVVIWLVALSTVFWDPLKGEQATQIYLPLIVHEEAPTSFPTMLATSWVSPTATIAPPPPKGINRE